MRQNASQIPPTTVAAAITEGQHRQLAFTVRRLLAAVTGIWLVMALGVFVF